MAGRTSERDGDPATRSRERSRLSSEDLERLVQERTRYLRLLSEITAIANESSSLESALRRAVERICVELGWSVGHVYMADTRDPGLYVDEGIWWLDDPDRLRAFVDISRRTAFRSGIGFIGRVIESAQAEWLPDAPAYPGALRTQEMRAAGLHAGIATPILIGHRVAGVVEFFSKRREPADRMLLEAMIQFGTQLGRTVERRELEQDVADQAVREQRRIGQELHDTLGQQVTAIELMVKGLIRRLQASSLDAEYVPDQLVGLVEDAKTQVRALSRGLVPLDVGPLGLMGALEDLVEWTRATYGVKCDFECDRSVEIEDDLVATQLYRIAQEATHNAVKHAGRGRIQIRLRKEDEVVSLSVQDEGAGIDPEARSRGRGLRIMYHRAWTIGASLTIGTPDDRGGTLVSCVWRRRSAIEREPDDRIREESR